MKMRVVVIAVLALAISLCAFSVLAENAKVKVSIWSTFTDAQDAYLRKTADEFNASQDQYVVEVQTQPNKGFTSTVYQSVTNGEGPDIIFNYGSEAAKYVGSGLVANLDEYIYDDEIGIENFDELLPEYLIDEINGFEDGHIHYLPGYTSGPVLFYNKTLFDELGITELATWNDIATACATIKEAKPDIAPFGIDSIVDIAQTLILETGATYIDTEAKEVGFAQASSAIEWLADMTAGKGYFYTTAPSGDYFSSDFSSGIVAMYYGSCAGLPYIHPDGFELGIAPAPSSGDDNAAYTIWNRGPIVFSANGKDAEKGAYLFVKYMLTTPEVAEGWAEACACLTPWKNAQEVEAYTTYVDNTPVLKAVQDNFDIGVAFPNVTGASETRDAIKEMVLTVAGGADPAEALAACIETSNNALQGK